MSVGGEAHPGSGAGDGSSEFRLHSHRMPSARISNSTPAPASLSSAADSSALWPAPTTSSRWPANGARSVWSNVCDTWVRGRDANGSGLRANCASPAATTTRAAVSSVPSSSTTRKAPSIPAHRRYPAAIELGHGVALEPHGVLDELLEQQPRLMHRAVIRLGVTIDRQGPLGVRDVRASPARAQDHAGWHVSTPELGWLTKAHRIRAGGAQVRGRGQAMRTCANNDDWLSLSVQGRRSWFVAQLAQRNPVQGIVPDPRRPPFLLEWRRKSAPVGPTLRPRRAGLVASITRASIRIRFDIRPARARARAERPGLATYRGLPGVPGKQSVERAVAGLPVAKHSAQMVANIGLNARVMPDFGSRGVPE